MKILKTSLFLLLPLFTFAQSEKTISCGLLGIGGGVSYDMNVRLKSYELFKTSFNTQFAKHITAPFGELRPVLGYHVLLENHFGPVYVSFIQHFNQFETSATFKNGDKQELKVDYHPIDFNLDFMFPLSKRADCGMIFGFTQQNATLYSGHRYVYNNLLSYGEDSPYNGIFTFRNNSLINLGVRFDYKPIKRIHISTRIEYTGFMNEYLSSKKGNLVPHADMMMKQSKSGAVNNDGILHYYLPENASDINKSSIYFVNEQYNTFGNTYQGWRAMLSVSYDVFNFNVKDN
jgi:hypothetical protein